METPAAALTVSEGDRTTSLALVWIDAREAIVAQWAGGEVTLERLESDVPAHHKSTGHVGHDPSIRHGGGGRQQTAGETQRLEHLARFVQDVAGKVPPAATVAIIGPGTVRDHLERVILDADAHHHATRTVTSEASPRLTDRQLVARLHALAGDGPRRHTVGAYRWTGDLGERSSGAPVVTPERVAKKPPREKVRVEDELAEIEEFAALAQAGTEAAAEG